MARVSKNDKKHILIVEDEELIRMALVARLSKHGYRCLEAENGAEALARLLTRHVDLVITDLGLPVISGYQLIEKMTARDRLKNIPVIVVTGQLDREFQWGSPRPETYATFSKPYDLDELLQVMAWALDGQEPPHDAIARLRK